MKAKDLTGQQFGRLTVLHRTEDHYYPSGRHDICYMCECECGQKVKVLGIHLRSGHTTSCGCFRVDTARQNMTKHGMTGTRLHNIWRNMIGRCYNQNHKNYDAYGGRGIRMCAEWLESFETFYEWALNNGYSDKLTLDRKDVNKGYEPSNCRWVTQKEQCNNTRRNVEVELNGETHTLKEWTEILGLNYRTIFSRIQRGWSPLQALTTPVRMVTEHI